MNPLYTCPRKHTCIIELDNEYTADAGTLVQLFQVLGSKMPTLSISTFDSNDACNGSRLGVGMFITTWKE